MTTTAHKLVSAPTSSPARETLSFGRIECAVTVFITGAVVMMVEILGTRIIAPTFGSTLFVWTALLVVTLFSLATGYYVGGIVVDRRPSPKSLALVVGAAGLLVALIPMAAHFVLEFSLPLGARMGPLLAASLLFSPSLACLGMTGPFAIRLSTEHVTSTGRRVGATYAISTMGSVVGTVLTSFFLIPNFATNDILTGGAILLTSVSVVMLVRRREYWPLAAALMPLVVASPEMTPLSGVQVIVAEGQSAYGLIQVIDDPRGVRLLRANHSVIGTQWSEGRGSGFAFLHGLEILRFMKPKAKNMLVIGLGVGSLPTALGRYMKMATDVVEIDPLVADYAQRYFGFKASGDVFVEDARTFISRTDRRYDWIVHDTFTGGSAPEHLLSLEVITQLKTLLRPDGVLALNLVGYSQGLHVEAAHTVYRTLDAVFDSVRVFRDTDLDNDPSGIVNLTFFAAEGTLDFNVPLFSKFNHKLCERAVRGLSSREVLTDVPDGAIITDEENPLARLQLVAAEEYFEAMAKLLPNEVWLHY